MASLRSKPKPVLNFLKTWMKTCLSGRRCSHRLLGRAGGGQAGGSPSRPAQAPGDSSLSCSLCWPLSPGSHGETCVWSPLASARTCSILSHGRWPLPCRGGSPRSSPAGKAVGDSGEDSPQPFPRAQGPRGPQASTGSHVTPVRPPPGLSRVQHHLLLSSASFLQCLNSSDLPERKPLWAGGSDFTLLMENLKQLSLSQNGSFRLCSLM